MESENVSRTRRLFWLLVGGYVIFGALFSIIGAALPQIIRTFRWSYTVTGIVLAASAVGYFVSSFISGLLVQRVSTKAVMTGGLLLGAVGMILFARTPSPWINLVLNFAIGLCQGAIEVVTNLEVVRMEKPGQSRLLNLIHAAFSVGAIAGPVAMGYLVAVSGNGTVAVFTVAGALSIVIAVFFAFARFPTRPADAPSREHGGIALLRQPLLLFFMVFLMLYVGAELGVSTWSSEYIVTTLGASESTGAFVVALFWGGILAGRLAVSWLYKGTRQEYLLLALLALASVSLAAAVFIQSGVVFAVGVLFTGLGLSAVYPLVMAMVGRYFKSGFAIGAAATGGGVGSFTFPLIGAVTAQAAGLRTGYLFYLAVCILLAVLSIIMVPAVHRRAAQERRYSND
ncbi:MAG TPA: MFS transporter [Spirochaetia bacterium]